MFLLSPKLLPKSYIRDNVDQFHAAYISNRWREIVLFCSSFLFIISLFTLTYWCRQPIPRRHQNGEMLDYVMTMATHDTKYDDVTMMLPPDDPSGALFYDTDPHSSYNLTLRGRNTAGWSPQHELVVPPANDGERFCWKLTSQVDHQK